MIHYELITCDDKNQWDRSLIVAVRDTAKERKKLEEQIKNDGNKKSGFLQNLFGNSNKEEKKKTDG